jgi:hypothetical protein
MNEEGVNYTSCVRTTPPVGPRRAPQGWEAQRGPLVALVRTAACGAGRRSQASLEALVAPFRAAVIRASSDSAERAERASSDSDSAEWPATMRSRQQAATWPGEQRRDRARYCFAYIGSPNGPIQRPKPVLGMSNTNAMNYETRNNCEDRNVNWPACDPCCRGSPKYTY